MNFKDLKKDYPVYVFDRKGEMDIITGKVLTDVAAPHMDYSHGNSMQMVVDVSIEIGDKAQVYVMPEGANTTVAPNDMIISTEIAPILREIDNMCMRSEEVVKSCPVHKHIIERGNALKEKWDPELRERRENNQRFENIENKIASIDDKFDIILKQLKKNNN